MNTLRWAEGHTSAEEFIKNIATVITLGEGDSFWKLEYPNKLGDIKNKAIMSTQPFLHDEGSKQSDKVFYLMIDRDETTKEVNGEIVDDPDKLNHVRLTVGDKLLSGGESLDPKHCSEPAKYSWYRNVTDAEGFYYGGWLPVLYFLNIDRKTINIMIQGDPSIDVRPNVNALFSYAYIGAIDSYEGGDTDIEGNWALTVGSDIAPQRSLKYGINTGTGVLDIIMLSTRSGAPYQAHTLKFKADNPYMDKYFIGPSEWTHKFHFDEPTVVHKYDRERGKLRNVLIGDRSALENNAELIYGKGTDDQRVYKCYQINSPYWFVEGSANPLYGVVLRKE